MLPDDIYHVRANLRNGDGTDSHHPAGRFLVHQGRVHVLEDYHGHVSSDVPTGHVDDLTLAKIKHPASHLSIASESEIRDGHRLDFIPDAKLQPMPQQPAVAQTLAEQSQLAPRPPSIWHYHRTGHDTAHTLEHHGQGKYSLDGNPLQDDEIHAILGNLRQKAATIRYKHSGVVDAVTKMERVFSNLRKGVDEDAAAEIGPDPSVEGEGMDPDAALAHLDSIHGGDETTKKAIASLRSRVFEDSMNPGLGNKFAYEQFRKKNVPGVWASLDLNDLKHANDTYGHDAGDDLIRASGKAIRQSVDAKSSKVFRSGGDEYVMHFPTHEHAAQAMRTLREKMDQITPVQGTYKPSFSAGLGHSFEHADKALYEAKKGKHKLDPATGQLARAHAPGQVPHMVHSLVPGFEGAVPLQPEQLPQIALPEGAKPASAPATPEPPKPSVAVPASAP